MSTIASINGVAFSLSMSDYTVTKTVEVDIKQGSFIASELQDDSISIFGLPNTPSTSQIHQVVPSLVNEQLLFTSLVQLSSSD